MNTVRVPPLVHVWHKHTTTKWIAFATYIHAQWPKVDKDLVLDEAKLLASFPGFPIIQFLIACSVEKQKGKAWSILQSQCRQGGEEFRIERMHFGHMFFVLNRDGKFFTSQMFKLQHLEQKLQENVSSSFIQLGPLSPSVYHGRHWHHPCDEMDLPPSFLHTASDQKLDGEKAWEQG